MITLALILSVLLLACIGGVLWYEGAGEEIASWFEDDREHPRPKTMWDTSSAPDVPLPDWYVRMQQGMVNAWPVRGKHDLAPPIDDETPANRQRAFNRSQSVRADAFVLAPASPFLEHHLTAPRASRKHLRGFASMDPAKQREIASRGGRKAHQTGRGHQWTSEEARIAGQKGGRNSHRKQG